MTEKTSHRRQIPRPNTLGPAPVTICRIKVETIEKLAAAASEDERQCDSSKTCDSDIDREAPDVNAEHQTSSDHTGIVEDYLRVPERKDKHVNDRVRSNIPESANDEAHSNVPEHVKDENHPSPLVKTWQEKNTVQDISRLRHGNCDSSSNDAVAKDCVDINFENFEVKFKQYQDEKNGTAVTFYPGQSSNLGMVDADHNANEATDQGGETTKNISQDNDLKQETDREAKVRLCDFVHTEEAWMKLAEEEIRAGIPRENYSNYEMLLNSFGYNYVVETVKNTFHNRQISFGAPKYVVQRKWLYNDRPDILKLMKAINFSSKLMNQLLHKGKQQSLDEDKHVRYIRYKKFKQRIDAMDIDDIEDENIEARANSTEGLSIKFCDKITLVVPQVPVEGSLKEKYARIKNPQKYRKKQSWAHDVGGRNMPGHSKSFSLARFHPRRVMTKRRCMMYNKRDREYDEAVKIDFTKGFDEERKEDGSPLEEYTMEPAQEVNEGSFIIVTDDDGNSIFVPRRKVIKFVGDAEDDECGTELKKVKLAVPENSEASTAIAPFIKYLNSKETLTEEIR